MTGIYHRFTILSFDTNELGIGFTSQNNTTQNFVHNPSNSFLNKLCTKSDFKSGTYYTNVCKNTKLKIAKKLYDDAKNKVLKKNPKYVLWPADSSKDNLYRFSGEVPDPMPNYKETGNPISIEFNPYYYTNKIKMKSFRLFLNNKEIKKTHILTKKNDPNKLFSSLQFALYSIDRLQRRSLYRVEFTFTHKSKKETIYWSIGNCSSWIFTSHYSKTENTFFKIFWIP